MDDYTEEELAMLKRKMYECLQENGFTDENVIAFRVKKRIKIEKVEFVVERIVAETEEDDEVDA